MKNIILSENEKRGYTLIARVKEDDTVHEYVVAWNFQADGTWGQGHYYNRLEDAMDYMYCQEVIEMVIKTMTYIDKNMDESTEFKDIERDMLKALIIDGMTSREDE